MNLYQWNFYAIDTALVVLGCYLLYRISRKAGPKTTQLRGPPSQSWFFGATGVIRNARQSHLIYQKWAKEYGAVYSMPFVWGSKKLMLHDPKAVAHFYHNEGIGLYSKTPSARAFIDILFGRGIVWAEGETHRRYRKLLAPAFSNSAIREITHIFYGAAHKAAQHWNTILEGSPNASAVIDVEDWMSRISLDSIGEAGFSHDFHLLDGAKNPLEALGSESGGTTFGMIVLLSTKFPLFMRIPNAKLKAMAAMKLQLLKIANNLFNRAKEDTLMDKSIVAQLLKGQKEDATFHLSVDEILAQLNVFILAGYETTSIALTWCLLELCRNPKVQEHLREELIKFGPTDPTYEQLSSATALPYLDAVVHETLRFHSPLEESSRIAKDDDVMPLSQPLQTESGEFVTSLFIAKGQVVAAPIRALNCSEELWGPDAGEFKPERWFDEEAQKNNPLQGHRHLLTFIDGARACLGKQFALIEFKAVLSVLVRNFAFEFDGGKELDIVKFPSLLPRPKDVTQEGPKIPLRVTQI